MKVFFEAFTTIKNIKIQVHGLQKDKAVVDNIANKLNTFLISEIKSSQATQPTPHIQSTPPIPVIKPAAELPTEVFTSTFDESLKGLFKIEEAIEAL